MRAGRNRRPGSYKLRERSWYAQNSLPNFHSPRAPQRRRTALGRTAFLLQPDGLPLQNSEQRLRALENLQVRRFRLLNRLIVIVPRGGLWLRCGGRIGSASRTTQVSVRNTLNNTLGRRTDAGEERRRGELSHLASDGVLQRGEALGEHGQITLDLRFFVILVNNLLVDLFTLLAQVLDA